jgi:hypothetical protein
VLDAIAERAGDVEEDAQNIIIQSKIPADLALIISPTSPR